MEFLIVFKEKNLNGLSMSLRRFNVFAKNNLSNFCQKYCLRHHTIPNSTVSFFPSNYSQPVPLAMVSFDCKWGQVFHGMFTEIFSKITKRTSLSRLILDILQCKLSSTETRISFIAQCNIPGRKFWIIKNINKWWEKYLWSMRFTCVTNFTISEL